jgi:N-acetylneuraminic acid mutarotase
VDQCRADAQCQGPFSTVVLNGKIYAIGGEHGHDQLHQQMSDMHVYDPATDTWTQLASMPIAKSHMESGTFVYNGRIVFAGGQTDNFNSTTNVVEYDPASDQWITLAPLPVQRQGAFVGVIRKKVVMTLGRVSTSSPLSQRTSELLPTTPASFEAESSDVLDILSEVLNSDESPADLA